MTLQAEGLLREHQALARQYGAVQRRCDETLAAQRREIEALQGEVLRLRAALVQRVSSQACAREDHARLLATIPGLPARAALKRRVEALVERVQDLMRERLQWQWRQEGRRRRAAAVVRDAPLAGDADARALEESLMAADLVICQTGCLSHGAYWRVQDHCRRTGKPCVVVEQPEALRIVRLHRDASTAA